MEIKENDRLASVGDPEKFHLVFGLWLHTVQSAVSFASFAKGQLTLGVLKGYWHTRINN